MIIDIPLITPVSRKYFEYASEKGEQKHHRTLDIRLCLEYICDEIIFEFVSDNDKKNWNKHSLHKKLKASSQFVDKDIVSKMIDTKI